MRQDRGGQVHPLIHVGPHLMELMRNGVLHCFWQFGLVYHLTDKEPITFLRWNAPGGSMRLAKVTQLGQRRHLVANGGGGEIEMVMLNQPL